MSTDVPTRCLPCPAKINLTLAVLGRREDGFHSLHSIVAQTLLGDDLSLDWDPDGSPAEDTITTTGSEIPMGENIVTTVLRRFRELTGFHKGAFHVYLDKRIPAGAGLGGGSSDAVAAIKALRVLSTSRGLAVDELALAAEIGSDCPLFLHESPVLMEGRGEQLTPLSPTLAGRLSGQPILLFKPRFSVPTAEAYRRLARLRLYSELAPLQRLLEEWEASSQRLPPRINAFERLLGTWMPSLPIVLERLRDRHGLDARLSGSGSACFLFTDDPSSACSLVAEEMERAWGEVFWLRVSKLK